MNLGGVGILEGRVPRVGDTASTSCRRGTALRLARAVRWFDRRATRPRRRGAILVMHSSSVTRLEQPPQRVGGECGHAQARRGIARDRASEEADPRERAAPRTFIVHDGVPTKAMWISDEHDLSQIRSSASRIVSIMLRPSGSRSLPWARPCVGSSRRTGSRRRRRFVAGRCGS